MNALNRLQWVFMLFVAGMLADLLLIEHFENTWQLIPVLFLIITIVSFLTMIRRPAFQSFFKIWMYLGAVSGAVGIFLHAKNNWEFAIELHSDLKGWGLISEVATGAIPVISPGFLIPIAILGLHVAKHNKD